MTDKDKPPLPDQYFEAESVGNRWHLYCKRCGEGWSLSKDPQPESLLRLLDHARSHDDKRRGQ
jgi:hypothetical protein